VRQSIVQPILPLCLRSIRGLEGAGGLGAQRSRACRLAAPDPVGVGAAEDALRQDHAVSLGQDRREQIGKPGRYVHAGRSGGGDEADR
jgi:hypothetical protein